jgi:hypothetical protein
MAKKAKKARRAVTSLAAVSDSANIPLVEVPAGGTLKIVVDVGPMAIPYTVQYAGRTIIKSLVDRAENVAPLEDGDRVLGWAFAHAVKGWHHDIGFSVNGGAAQLLESKSEANKDPDHSVGVAIVRVGG